MNTTEPTPTCPQCGSNKLYKDGLRYLADGTTVQRWLCRECGYRFTNPNHRKRGEWKNPPFNLNLESGLNNNCQGNNDPVERDPTSLGGLVQTLAAVENEEKAKSGRAGAAKNTEYFGINSKLVDYAWQLKKKGLAEIAIKQRIYRLRKLLSFGADLLSPDSVSSILALHPLDPAYKRAFIVAYKSFAKIFNLQWDPPRVRVDRKVPFIPTEEEIDTLIAGCGRKTAAFLQLLKDTGARGSEACKLKWQDVDEKMNVVRINNPTKGSMSRVVKVSPKTIAMLKSLPKTGEFIFNTNIATIRKNFTKQRNKIAAKLQNPRLKQIHLHTIRHWKATMEYYKTKDIKYVQYLLGHKKIENTDIYTHLINFEGDEWHVAVARNLEEEKKLIEVGFEFVRYSEKDGVATYRKRK